MLCGTAVRSSVNLFFFAFLTKGNNFLTFCLLPWRTKPFSERVNSSSEEFAPLGANFFVKEFREDQLFQKRICSSRSKVFPLRDDPYWKDRQKWI